MKTIPDVLVYTYVPIIRMPNTPRPSFPLLILRFFMVCSVSVHLQYSFLYVCHIVLRVFCVVANRRMHPHTVCARKCCKSLGIFRQTFCVGQLKIRRLHSLYLIVYNNCGWSTTIVNALQGCNILYRILIYLYMYVCMYVYPNLCAF